MAAPLLSPYQNLSANVKWLLERASSALYVRGVISALQYSMVFSFLSSILESTFFLLFSWINLGGSFEIQQLRIEAAIYEIACFYSDLLSRGIFLFWSVWFFIQWRMQKPVQLLSYRFHWWHQADFFMFTFSFSEIFVYPDFIFHTFFSFWIFICIYPDHFSLSIFIWNPTAIPNSIFKELFQFMIQNLFHQLILSWKSISVFFLHQSLMIHLWSFHLESILLFPLFIIVIMNDFCFHYQSSIFFKSFIFLWYLFIYQLSI